MTIFCPNCGKSVSSDYQYCPYCGGKISMNTGNTGGHTNTGNTGFPPPPFQNQNQQQSQPQNQQSGWPFPFPNTNRNGGGTTGTGGGISANKTLGCLASVGSFLIPLIGIVIWLMYRNKDQAMAKRYLMIALAGVAFNLLVNVVGAKYNFSYFHNLMGY
ncbi:MAG: zinc ribbon domain-containing protein [Bacteroidales bacterium]|nr:zinc ribbon domain-containing protein [Bacteroidales bacterium]